MSDLPTFKKFVQIFFLKKIWRQQTLPTYDLTYVLNFAVFFLGMLPNRYIFTNANSYRQVFPFIEIQKFLTLDDIKICESERVK